MQAFDTNFLSTPRRVLTLVLAGLLCASGGVRASSFFQTPEELSLLPAQDRAVARQNVERLIPRSRTAASGPVRIDDMLFRPEQLLKRSGFTGPRWTNGIVYYQFDSAVTPAHRVTWLTAANEWVKIAHLSFVEGTGIGDYILVMDSTANNSYVGMIGGEQIMNLFNWDSKGVIEHEIGHALGLQHEHTRSDRDSFVIVLYENITPGEEHNFAIAQTVNIGAYDFGSIMHYNRNGFSANGGDTLRPKQPFIRYLNTMGQLTQLSLDDKIGMAQRYGARYVSQTDLSRYMRQIQALRRKIAHARKKLHGAIRLVTIRNSRMEIAYIWRIIRGY